MPNLETIGPTPAGNWTFTGTVNLAYLVGSGIITGTSMQTPLLVGSNLTISNDIVCSGTTQSIWLIASGGGLIASETAQKIGFYGYTPLVQQNSITACDITDTAGIVTAVNNLIARLGSLGLISMTS